MLFLVDNVMLESLPPASQDSLVKRRSMGIADRQRVRTD
jgi:hypothetical protein